MQSKGFYQVDRQASADMKLPRGSTLAAKPGALGSLLWKQMFADARKAFGKEDAKSFGLVGVKDGRAWFQVWADPTPYSIALSEAEKSMFI